MEYFVECGFVLVEVGDKGVEVIFVFKNIFIVGVFVF